jgi:hypothetical protein
VSDFAALTALSAPWFEQQKGIYTGRFALREVQAPTSPSAPIQIDGFDYERSAAGSAEIPDPRNSEHKILSQVQNLFESAHNDCVDRALAGTISPSQQQVGAAFDACHYRVLWTYHYQTIVATDFLPRISAEATLNRVAPGALHAYVRDTIATSTLPEPADVHTFLYGCKPGRGNEATIHISRRIPGLHDATAEVRQVLAMRLASAGFDPDFLGASTPLWLFVLAEAESTEHSQRLGELGSHIVDEFLLGSLRCDEASVLYAAPADLHGWGPTERIARHRRYSMPELIAYLQSNAMVSGQPVRLFSR